MGYWGKHPMAGDAPLDAKCDLTSLLFTIKEMENDVEYNDDLYKERLITKLNKATQIEYSDGQRFVLPFVIAELGIRIKNFRLSQQIKEMIGDGGAKYRGYSSVIAIKETYLSTYNGFNSPLDYANQLRNMWDDLMSGKKDFDDLNKQDGLIEAICTQPFGPINMS